MIGEVFIPLNDIATEGYECGRPGEYDETTGNGGLRGTQKGALDLNAADAAGYPVGIATSTRRLRGAS